MHPRLPRAMLLAFLMADHARLGRDACGGWRRWCGDARDVLRLILEQLHAGRGVVRAELHSGSAEFGRGLLKDPRALALRRAPAGTDDAQVLVADAGSGSIKVFDSTGFVTEFVMDAPESSSDSEWIHSESSNRRCPLGLAVTSRGDLVVAQGEGMGVGGTEGGARRPASLALYDSRGVRLREIVAGLPFDGPYTLEADSADRVTILHRTGLAVFDVYSTGADSAPLAQIEFPDQESARTGWVKSLCEREGELQRQIAELQCRSGTEKAVQLILEELSCIGQARREKDADTTVVPMFGDRCGILQFAAPCGLATDGDGRILVVDWARDRLQVLERDGSLFVSCGASVDGMLFGYTPEDVRRADVILEPSGVAVDDLGQIAAVDSDAKCVKVYANSC